MKCGKCHKDYRCSNCKKLLFRGVLVDGEIEVKCKSCKQMSVISENSLNEMICTKIGCPNRQNILNL